MPAPLISELSEGEGAVPREVKSPAERDMM